MTAWLQRAARAKARMGLDPLAGDRPDEAFENVWRRSVKQRTVLLVVLLGLWVVGLVARLVWLQVVQHDELLDLATEQRQEVIRVPAGRGDIVDRHGRPLAYSVKGASMGAAGNQIEDAPDTAKKLCQALGDCTPAEVAQLAERFALGRWVPDVRKARELTPNQIAAVEALDLKGIHLTAGSRRWYPNRELAAQLIGFVGVDDQGMDNKGLAGVERKFDEIIRGRDGLLRVQYDAGRQRLSTRVEQEPTTGATVELTVDVSLQHIVERELDEAVRAHKARGGSVVVMDPMTGAILSMASSPTFNPNQPAAAPKDYQRNRAVQEVYEPGSTLKTVTASAALEEGVLRTTDLIDCSQGSIRFGNRTIYDDHRIGVVSFEDVIVHSSNVGASKAGQMVGAELLGRYLKRFGFGQRLAPASFAGGSPGRVFDPASLDPSALASVSMGYQISVTPLQMAAAVSAIANGGQLLEPHLVRATIRDGVRTATEPTVLRRAIEAETAATVTSMMEEVVRRGTGRAAALDRYQVAGKTGTAEKVVGRRYNGEYNSSFVGFVPSRRPAVTIIVVIDAPRAGQIYGGAVAAPTFKRIAEAAMRQLGVPPTINPIPPAIVAEPVAPGAGVSLPASRAARPPTVTPAVVTVEGRGLMPDVRGLSGRAALLALARAGLTVRMIGNGFVVDQDPLPGLTISPGATAALKLSQTAEGTTPGTSPGTTPRTRR